MSLDPSPAVLQGMLAEVGERLAAWLAALPEAPARDDTDGATVAAALRAELSEEGTPLDEVLSLLFDRALPPGLLTAGGGYLAYIPGGGLPLAAVGSLIGGVVNRYTGLWTTSPGAVQLEVNVVRWLQQVVGYGEGAGGILTSGGSMATFSAVFTARRARPGILARGRLLTSDQAHHSVVKAAMLAGFEPEAVVAVPSDASGRLTPTALREAIDRVRREGEPFLVVANAGTTNTGAVDDLEGLADVCAAEGLHLHVDAAYGGFFALTERGRAALRGLERADSITLDPHKGLFLPYGTGALMVRDQEALRRAHQVTGDYLPPTEDHPEHLDWYALSPELSRPFRGLPVWLPLVLHGVGAFRQALDDKLDLAQEAAEALAAMPDVEVLAPVLSLLAFRVVPPGLDAEAVDALNRRILERIDARRRVHLTGTRFKGRFVIRICVLAFRTTGQHLRHALEDVEAAIAEVRSPRA